MTVATLAGAPEIENAGFVFRPLAVPSRGSTELAVWSVEASPGARSETHTVDKEEVFVLQEGSATVLIGDREHVLGPGDTAIAPPHTPLRLSNPGERPARLLVCTSKGILGTLNGKTISPPWAQ
ncbi:cupin domain-containing protein [Amycolatopsis nigrescens]|uniref:cupin domain-containing protein n=1 Tax=Amycolatopsis nigrescens TaxID=381445 RepID=UPI000362E0F3|nr:cupin domain-containing protein [Amycolatopsis nigrescens]